MSAVTWVYARILSKRKRYERIGSVFKGIKIVDHYEGTNGMVRSGWVDCEEESLCFDPELGIDVWWRDEDGVEHRDGVYPDCSIGV